MTSHSRHAFRLKDDIVNTFCVFKQHNVDQQLNAFQIGGFRRLLSHALEELEFCNGIFECASNAGEHKTVIYKMYLNQSLDLVTELTETLKYIESVNNEPTTKAFPVTLNELLDAFKEQLEELKSMVDKLDSSIDNQKMSSRSSTWFRQHDLYLLGF